MSGFNQSIVKSFSYLYICENSYDLEQETGFRETKLELAGRYQKKNRKNKVKGGWNKVSVLNVLSKDFPRMLSTSNSENQKFVDKTLTVMTFEEQCLNQNNACPWLKQSVTQFLTCPEGGFALNSGARMARGRGCVKVWNLSE